MVLVSSLNKVVVYHHKIVVYFNHHYFSVLWQELGLSCVPLASLLICSESPSALALSDDKLAFSPQTILQIEPILWTNDGVHILE